MIFPGVGLRFQVAVQLLSIGRSSLAGGLRQRFGGALRGGAPGGELPQVVSAFRPRALTPGSIAASRFAASTALDRPVDH